MPAEPLRLLVLARDQSLRVRTAWERLESFLGGQTGVDVGFAELADDLDLSRTEAEIVAVLGGDGAILRACRQLGTRQVPLLGINLGRLGFLADLSPEEFVTHFGDLQARNYRVVEHLMFECVIRTANGAEETHLGLNEVALTAAVCLRMLDIELRIDGAPVTTYSCDGLIVSTPVGSTGHSLSAGGPILRQQLQAFVITPICPHTLTNRPLVDSAEFVYSLKVGRAAEGATVVIDGQIRRPLAVGDVVEIRRAAVTFRLVKLPGASYYSTLHRKLGWGGQPRYQGG